MQTRSTVFLSALATFTALTAPGAAWANDDGMTGFSGQTASTCDMCHSSGAFSPASSLDGPLQVAPSSVANAYTFEVAATLASVGGFDVSADAGALGTTDAGAQVSSGEVTHTTPRAFVGDVATFSFEWTAPATEGTYTLFGCGVAADGDGLLTGDGADCTTLDVLVCADADADSVCDSVDNCPSDANDAQVDTDADGLGDACDDCPADAANDADADGVCGDVDNCPIDANPSQTDSDGDGVGDACDACPADAANDEDSDGVCADVDNCPLDGNEDQADADGDGIGDACDAPDDTGDTGTVDTGDSDTGDSDTDTGGSGDTDDTGGTGDTKVGCSCSTSPTGSALALLPALVGLTLLRRRRSGK
ncbi:hypothetical protein LBMAG42_14540 [Deltaproteobacteria bacterium]|nr:hypothetical protein LBMAG42_14540 [Deltaproteobacteria bacterium]